MKVLVTGGGGFLGGRIVGLLLERGHSVRSIGRSPQPENLARGVEVIEGDLTRSEDAGKAVMGCEVVFHVAAKAGVWGPYDEYFAANVTATRNVLEACKSSDVQTLVYTSTPSVTFNGRPIRAGDESLPLTRGTPLSHYATTKAMAEAEVLALAAAGSVRVCALRPHLIWGVGDPHLVPRVIARARSGRLRIVGDGQNKVDLTHVDNAADAHMQAMDALLAGKANGRAFFISDDSPVALWDWINNLLKRLGEEPVKKTISYRAAHNAGAMLEFIWRACKLDGEPPMTRFVAAQLSEDHWFDISAAKNVLGYTPAVNHESALENLVRSLT